MRADKYHQGVPTDRWQPYRFRDPLIAAMATLAALTGATMSAQIHTFTSGGSWTAPALLVPGTVQVTVAGGQGGTNTNFPFAGGLGAIVSAVIPTSPGDVLTVTVGTEGGTPTAGTGLHAGGPGGVSSPTGGGGGGGGSTGIVRSGTTLVEAAGGGGTGDYSGNFAPRGSGGPGGTPNGTNGDSISSGTIAPFPGAGATLSADGAGGSVAPFNNETAGTSGSSGIGGTGGNGATAQHGGGGGGGGGGCGGGGGGGGGYQSSASNCGPGGGGGATYVDPSLLSVSETASNSGNGYVVIAWQVYDAPPQPTLVSPANASFIDSNGSGVVFTATYNGDDTLAKIALRVSKDGAAYGYWNGTNFTSSTPVWLTPTTGAGVAAGGTYTESVPAAVLANSHNYAWSFAAQDVAAGVNGAFASDSIFTAAAQPTINSLAPVTASGTVTPIVSWTATLGAGDSQISYRYMIYATASTPGSPGALYDSGVVASAATSFTLPSSAGLLNGQTYFGYLQITETGPNASQWLLASFAVVLDGPAGPMIILSQISDPTTGMPEPQIIVVENDNLVTSEDSTFEGASTGTFTATNATISNVSTWSADGSRSLQASSTASGAVSIFNNSVACSPGQVVTAMATVQQPTLTQTVTLSVRFLNSSGMTLATSTIASAAASVAGVVLSGQSSAAPAGTVFADLIFSYTATGASQLTRFDKIALFNGVVATWTKGGFVGVATAEVQASYDGGNTWSDLRFGAAVTLTNQSGVAIDYESPFNVSLQYRARIVGSQGGQVLPSPWSAVSAIDIPSLRWWILDPLAPSNSMALIRVDSGGGTTPPGSSAAIVINKTMRQGIFRGFGSKVANVVYGDTWSDEFDLTLFFDGETTWSTFDAIRDRKATVLFKSDMTGHRYYMSLGADRPASIVSESGRQGNPRRGLVIHCTPVAVP